MKLNQKITLTLCLLAGGGVGYAQNSTAVSPLPPTSYGLLGQQYTEISFGVEDVNGVDAYGQTASVTANTPHVAEHVDAGASYAYSWTGGVNTGHANTIGIYGRSYRPMKGVKPFLSAGLGWTWTNTTLGGSDNRGLWGGSFGLEIPLGKFAVTPRITYADDFEGSSKSRQAWAWAVEANYWLSRGTGLFASVGYVDVCNSSNETWTYVLGLRGRF